MALILLVGVAYATYSANQSGADEEETKIDLKGKTSVTLLPLEQTLGLLETPMSTITYFDGNYKVAAEHLMERIAEMVKLNPWLGGWAARAPGEREVKLWYDETGGSVAPGTFYVFEPGEVPLMDDTPYEEYEELGKNMNLERKAKVLSTQEMIGKDQALWRVTVVPTADKPDSRFAVIVSMSRLLGDPYTFYMLYNMLNKDKEIIKMNPKRRLEYSEALMEHVGRDEAFYIKKVTSNPLWEWSRTDKDPTKTVMFRISEEWLVEECGVLEGDEDEQNSTINTVLTCWFFKKLNPTVGMMAVDFRDALSGGSRTNMTISSHLSALDAGNYSNTLLYTPVDYATPELIKKSEQTLKRCGSDPPTPLPGPQWDATFSVTTNWSSLYWEGMNFGEGVQETLHLPLYDATGLSIVPNKMSIFFLFTAHPGTADGSVKRSLGAMVTAPKSYIEDIESCGIVGEKICKF